MIQNKLVVLVLLTSVAFMLVQGLRLLTDEGWSWIATACYGVALAFQVFALWQIPRAEE